MPALQKDQVMWGTERARRGVGDGCVRRACGGVRDSRGFPRQYHALISRRFCQHVDSRENRGTCPPSSSRSLT